MRSVLVEVTQPDIEAGVIDSTQNSPVSLAANRATGRVTSVSLSRRYICVRPGEEYDAHLRALPPEAVEFLFAFDCGGPTEPFSFDLETP